jgi:hypothetical protein
MIKSGKILYARPFIVACCFVANITEYLFCRISFWNVNLDYKVANLVFYAIKTPQTIDERSFAPHLVQCFNTNHTDNKI